MFSEKEIAYLKSQKLARIATVSADGEPDVAPVGFTFDGQRFHGLTCLAGPSRSSSGPVSCA